MSNKVEYVRHTQDVKYCDQARSVELRKHSSTDSVMSVKPHLGTLR